MEQDVPEKKTNGNYLKESTSIPTWLLIILMGGGNFLAISNADKSSHEERERALNEIHALHGALGDFEKRQKDVLEKLADLLSNQTQMIKNQSQVLDGQGKILSELRQERPR